MHVNAFGEDWDLEQDQPGFCWKRLRLGRRLGARELGASVFELPPGQRAFPYHFHHGNEELLLVLDGSVHVRCPDGEKSLTTGDSMSFPRGPEGAHAIANRTDTPARILIVSTMTEPDITELPDTGKVGLFAGAAPGGLANQSRKVFLDGSATADYFKDEPAE